MEYFQSTRNLRTFASTQPAKGWGPTIDTLGDEQMFKGMRARSSITGRHRLCRDRGETQLAVNRRVEGRHART